MAAERLVVLNPGDELYPTTSGKPKRRNAGTRTKPMATRRRRRKATSKTRRPARKAAPKRNSTPRKRRRTSTSASAAAKKGAATRKRNAAKRSAQAKKAAATRRRRAAAKKRPARRNPRRTAAAPKRRRRTAAAPKRRRRTTTATRRRNPSRKRRTTTTSRRRTTRRRSTGRSMYRNPATMKGFVASLKTAAQVGAILLPLRALVNYIGAWPTAKEGELVTQTLAQKVGPFYDVGLSALALFVVPKYVLKGSLAKYKDAGTAALHANLILSGLRLIAWYARRGWKADGPALVGEQYPRWTDYIEFPEPQAKAAAPGAVQGAPHYRRSVAGPRLAGRYQPSLGSRSRSLVFNPGLGRYVEASGY